MNFQDTLASSNAMLTEGAIAERLRRRDDLGLHPTLFNTPLIYDEYGRRCMEEIYGQYREAGGRRNIPVLLCAPTWRVDRIRIEEAGFGPELNRDAVKFMRGLQNSWHREDAPVFVGGLIGPKNDCYKATLALSGKDAREYHRWQVQELAESGVDCLIAQTIPAVSEAIGIAKACSDADVPYIISFVINRNGFILDNVPLADGVAFVDKETENKPVGFMVNCVFPTFIRAAEQPEKLFQRLVGIQANASSKDHDQLDNSAVLRQDNIDLWGSKMLELNRRYGVKILGGCCGTDDRYIDYLARGLAGEV